MGPAVQPALGQVRRRSRRRSPTAMSTSRSPISTRTATCWRSTSRSATRPGATGWSSTTRTTTSLEVSGPRPSRSDVAPDGRIFVLTQEIGQDDLPQYPHLKAPRIDDYVAVLSPDGQELKKVRIIDSLLRSPYARLLDTVPWYIQKGAGDYLHTNSIEILDGRGRTSCREATAGRLLLSFREIGTIAIFDPENEEIVWAMRGPWLRQHDPGPARQRQHPAVRQSGPCRPGRHHPGDRGRPQHAGDRLDLRRHARGAVRERGALLPGAARQRQHADHRVRRRPPVRGHAATARSSGTRSTRCAASARATSQDGDPDRLLGRADRSCIAGPRGAAPTPQVSGLPARLADPARLRREARRAGGGRSWPLVNSAAEKPSASGEPVRKPDGWPARGGAARDGGRQVADGGVGVARGDSFRSGLARAELAVGESLGPVVDLPNPPDLRSRNGRARRRVRGASRAR